LLLMPVNMQRGRLAAQQPEQVVKA
jgi:hypothetical protein